MTEDYFLDLRGIACPMNFVKTRLQLDKLQSGQILKLFLDDGEPVESVCRSVGAEGHEILNRSQEVDGHYLVLIRKSAS